MSAARRITPPTSRALFRLPALLPVVFGVVLSGALFGPAGGTVALAGDEPRPVGESREVHEKAQARELLTAMRSKDPETRAEAAEKAAANQHASLTSPLVRLLADSELGVRHMAMQALATRESASARKKAAAALTPKLKRLGKHPADRDELMRVIDTLRQLRQPASIKPLLDHIDIDMEIEEVQARLAAVAAVPDAEAIERLIQFLARGRRGGVNKQREAAEKALRWATGQRFGRDPDKWRAWWRENEQDFSFEAMAEERAEAERQQKAKQERRKKQKKAREGRKKKGGKPRGDPQPKGPSD